MKSLQFRIEKHKLENNSYFKYFNVTTKQGECDKDSEVK